MCFWPDTVEDVAIRINPQHNVLHGGVMDEGALWVDEEHIRNPDLLDQAGIKSAALVAAGGEGQAVVLPVMPQVQRHGEVLETRATQTNQAQKSGRAGGGGGTSGTVSGGLPCSLPICCRCSQPGRRYQREEPTLQKVRRCQTSASFHTLSVCTSGRD